MPWHKVCHKWIVLRAPHAVVLQVCTRAPTRSAWWDRIHRFDPDPAPFTIEGVAPELVSDGEGLAAIEAVATALSPELAKTIREAVARGSEQLQQRLPKDVQFQITSEAQP